MSIPKLSVDKAPEQLLDKKIHNQQKKNSFLLISSSNIDKQRNRLQLIQEQNLSNNPIKNYNFQQKRKWENAQQQLQILFNHFKQNLQKILLNIIDQNKYYKVLSYMRENEILSDLALTINDKIIKENFSLKKQTHLLKQTVTHLSKNQRQIKNKQKHKQFQNSNAQNESSGVKIDSTRSMPQIIYNQAKTMNQKDFVEWCERILMKDKIIITQLRRQSVPNKLLSKTYQNMSFHRRSFSQIYEKQIRKDDPVLYQKYSSIIKKIQNISPFFQQKLFEDTKNQLIQEIQNLKVQTFSCKNFCCSVQKQNMEAKLSISNKNQKKGSKFKSQREVYRDNKMEEYFQRYYKHPNFKVNLIKSVEKTHGEEMVRLENAYTKMIENRSRTRYGY